MEYTLIDVDSHITEAPDTWTDRVASKYRDRVPRVERRDGEDVWLIDGERATTVGPTAPAGWTEPMPTMPLRLTGDTFVPLELEETYTDACRKRKLL